MGFVINSGFRVGVTGRMSGVKQEFKKKKKKKLRTGFASAGRRKMDLLESLSLVSKRSRGLENNTTK